MGTDIRVSGRRLFSKACANLQQTQVRSLLQQQKWRVSPDFLSSRWPLRQLPPVCNRRARRVFAAPGSVFPGICPSAAGKSLPQRQCRAVDRRKSRSHVGVTSRLCRARLLKARLFKESAAAV